MKLKKQIAKLICMGLVVSAGYGLTQYNVASAEVTKGGSITFSPGVVISSIPGLEITTGGYGKIGFGNERGTSSGAYLGITGYAQTKEDNRDKAIDLSKNPLGQVEYVNPAESPVGKTVVWAEVNKQGAAIFDGKGNVIAGPSKNTGGFYVYTGKNYDQPELVVVTRDKNGATINDLTTGEKFSVPDKNAAISSDVNYIVVDGKKGADLYTTAGQKINNSPIANYFSIGSAKFGSTLNVKKDRVQLRIVDKQTGDQVSDNVYSDLAVASPTSNIVALEWLDNKALQGVVLNQAGKAWDELANSPASKAKVPKTLGMSKRPVTKVYTGYSEGVAIVKTVDGIFGIDEEGNVLFRIDDGKYDTFYPMKNGIFLAQRKVEGLNIFGILNTALGLYTGTYYTDADYAWVNSNRKFDYLDKNGKVVISADDQKVSPRINGYVYVLKDYRMGLYRENGDVLFPPKDYKLVAPITPYDPTVKGYENDLVVAQKPDGLWGLITWQNKEVVPFEFKTLDNYDRATLRLVKNKEVYYYNLNAKKLLGPYYWGAQAPKGIKLDFKGTTPLILIRLKADSPNYSLLNPVSGAITPTKISTRGEIVDIGNNLITVREEFNHKKVINVYDYNGNMVNNQLGTDIKNGLIKKAYLINSK